MRSRSVTEGCGDEAQVTRGGLAQREDAPAELVHLHLLAVDLAVALLDGLRERGVPLGEGAHAVGDELLHLARHRQERVAQLAEVLLEGLVGVWAGHGFPSRTYR
jgi:hypothetical protein